MQMDIGRAHASFVHDRAQACRGDRRRRVRRAVRERHLRMEIGVDSFAAILPDRATGKPPSPTDRIAYLLEEVEAADRAGSMCSASVSEHHRADRTARHCGCADRPRPWCGPGEEQWVS